jgi:carbamoyltransferase
MYILGLATMGESAAALMKDGVLVAAVEEERFTRVKHEGCFPLRAITSCLNRAGISLAEVAHIGVYWQPLRMGVRTKAVLKTALTHPTAFLGRWVGLCRNSRLRAADKQWQVREVGWNCFWFAPS